jgi:hypothetical protein
MPTPLMAGDVNITDKEVKINGSTARALANSLIQNNGIMLSEMSADFGFVNPHSISIGADGSVIIADPNVAAKVASLKGRGVTPLMNIDCNC